MRAAHTAGRAVRPVARVAARAGRATGRAGRATGRAAMRRVVRPVGKATRTAATRTGHRLMRTRPVAAARRARGRARVLGRNAATWYAARRTSPGYGVRRPALTRRRQRAYAVAGYIAANGWQAFLRGTGLARSRTWHRAADVARTGWDDFLRGTGLADLDKGVGDPFGPGAKPLIMRTDPAPPAGGPSPGGSGPHTSTAGGAVATASRTGGTAVVNFARGDINVRPPILQGADEAFQQASQQFEPVNANGKLSAGAVRQYMRELAQFVENVGNGAQQVGQKSAEQIYTLPASAALLQQLGRYLQMAAQELAEASDSYDRIHDKDVERWFEDDERANSLDRQDNRPM